VPIPFTPQYPGLRTGAMRFTANGASSSLGLYGTGLAPQAIVGPGIIRTILDSADPSGGIVLVAPQQIAVALDAAENLYIAETGANLVRKVNLVTGIISTVAGKGPPGYSGDNDAATSATLNTPAGIAVNAVGDIFIADTGNNVIRRVYALGGIIVAVAGTGNAGYTGDGGDAEHAQLNHPQSVTLDSTGRLYVADTGNNVIRAVDPVTRAISTVAGNGTAGLSGDGGPAVNAQLHLPSDVAVDAAGNLYIADAGNARIRKLNSQSGTLVTLAGSTLIEDEGDGGPANAAALTTPTGVAVDSLGQLSISDPGNDTVRRVSNAAPTLNFGSETVGSATAGQTDSLSNIGNQSLAIDQFPAPPVPADFVLSPDSTECSAGDLAPGDNCDISYAFQPHAGGLLTEDAWILDNSLDVAGTRQAVAMTGNGILNSQVATRTKVAVDPATAAYGIPIRVTANVSDATGAGGDGNARFCCQRKPGCSRTDVRFQCSPNPAAHDTDRIECRDGNVCTCHKRIGKQRHSDFHGDTGNITNPVGDFCHEHTCGAECNCHCDCSPHPRLACRQELSGL
jgi:hypothetical protein